MVNAQVEIVGTAGGAAIPVSSTAVKNEDAVHASGDAGVHILGVRASATPTTPASAAGDYASMMVDVEGKTVVTLHAAPEQTKQARVDFTATSDLQLLPSAGAGLRNYITDITVENTGAAAARFLLRDGTTTIWSATVPAGSTLTRTFGTALRGTAATVVNGQLGAAGTVTVSVSGFAGV